MVSVELDGSCDAAEQLLLESEDLDCDLQMEQTLLTPFKNGTSVYQVVIENCTGFSQILSKGASLGIATEIEEDTPIVTTGHKLIS